MDATRNWTPEPWTAGPPAEIEPGDHMVIRGADDGTGHYPIIARFLCDPNPSDATRAAACVNKLAGHADLDAVEVVNAEAIKAAREALEWAANSDIRSEMAVNARRALKSLGGGK